MYEGSWESSGPQYVEPGWRLFSNFLEDKLIIIPIGLHSSDPGSRERYMLKHYSSEPGVFLPCATGTGLYHILFITANVIYLSHQDDYYHPLAYFFLRCHGFSRLRSFPKAQTCRSEILISGCGAKTAYQQCFLPVVDYFFFSSFLSLIHHLQKSAQSVLLKSATKQ